MYPRIFIVFFLFLSAFFVDGQTPFPIKRFLTPSFMQGASFSIMAKEVQTGTVLYDYDSNRELIPASVMKTITTATALDILGGSYRYETRVEYDGSLTDGILNGNIYIHGSGDPTLGSSYLKSDKDSVIRLWISEVHKAGIRQINGSVIADEQCFDAEGVSMKWMREDLGSYYGQGSYGLSVFDNLYRIDFLTGAPGTSPVILDCTPQIPGLSFRNYLKAASVFSDSCYIVGSPFSGERSLFGIIPAHRKRFSLEGDIPDPALFLAQYITAKLASSGIKVSGEPATFRILNEAGKWKTTERKTIAKTYSPELAEIARITNHVSHNLFADALLKIVGERYKPERGEVISSFGKGVKVLQEHWKQKGLDTRSLWMFDGSGLAITDRLTTSFVCDIYRYMITQSGASEAFFASLPKVGEGGTVKNFLKGTSLQGRARFKSGSMSRVRGYGGYLTKDGKQYAICLFVNNFSCTNRQMTAELEKLLVSLF